MKYLFSNYIIYLINYSKIDSYESSLPFILIVIKHKIKTGSKGNVLKAEKMETDDMPVEEKGIYVKIKWLVFKVLFAL